MLEQDTQTRQRELRKGLGPRNLVFSQFLNIVGLFWIGAAAKLGPANVSFWLCGVALFYLPSAVVVIYLNRARTRWKGALRVEPPRFQLPGVDPAAWTKNPRELELWNYSKVPGRVR